MKKTNFIKSIVALAFGMFMSYLFINPTSVMAAPTYTCEGGSTTCVEVEVLGGTVTFYKSDPTAIT